MIKAGILSILHSPNRKRLISNFLSLSVIQGANYIIPLLILPYIVRIIGPEKFGLLSYAQAFVYYFTIVINYSFDYTATREISLVRDNPRKLSEIYSSVFFCKLVLLCIATVFFAAAVLTVDLFNKNAHVFLLTYLINVGFVFFPSWFFQGVEQLSKTAFFNFMTKVIFAVMVVLLINEEADFFFYALGNSLSQIAIGIAAFLYGIHHYKIRIHKIPLQKIWMTFREGISVFFSNIAISLYTTTNLMILGFFTSEREYGYFSAALKIALVTQSLVILPLGLSLFAHIGKAMHQSSKQGINMIVRYAKVISIVTFIISLLIFALAEQLITLLFGQEFIQGTIYLKIMAFMPFVSGLNNLVSVQGLLNLKKDKEFLLITFITFAFSLLLNFILVPLYHGTATAIILLASEICMTSFACFYLFKRTVRI